MNKTRIVHTTCVLVLSVVTALWMHFYMERSLRSGTHSFAGTGGVNVYVNSLVGLRPEPRMEPTQEELRNPEYKKFIDAVVRLAKPLLLPTEAYEDQDVYAMGPWNSGYGWPLRSRAPMAQVVIDYEVAGREPRAIEFWIDERGEEAMRLTGLVGNMVFYFLLLSVLSHGCLALARKLGLRFGRKVRAFPIVSPEDKGSDKD